MMHSILKLTIRLSFLVLIVLITASCGNSDTPQPSPFVLTESDSGSKVALKQGQIISVSLKSNPSTGYAWAIVPGSELYLSQQGASEFVSDNSNIPGAGGVLTFKFMAIASGDCTLKLIYRQPWMTDVAPAKTFEVAITVGS